MGSWMLRWNFDKESYSPNETTSLNLWIDNTGDTNLYISAFSVEFDFGKYQIQTISGTVAPQGNVGQVTTSYLGNGRLLIPNNVVGRKIFSFEYRVQEYVNNNWVDLGIYRTDTQYFINIYPKPFYKVFVSRGLRIEDRAVGDPIAEMIREWGFSTITIGIEINVPENQIADQIKTEIKNSDAVIVIATPRILDSLTGFWKTLEWAHDEIGIAFGVDKPLLIIKDRNVTLGGLPSYLSTNNKAPSIEFDQYNLNDLKLQLSSIMPSFREWVTTKRGQQFNNDLKDLIVGGLAIIGGIALLSGIVGESSDSSHKRSRR